MSKDFTKSPAMQILKADTEPAAPPAPTADTPKRKGRILKNPPVKREARSRRIQLLMQPSLYDRVKTGAEIEGLSFNEFVHCLLLEALEKKV